MYLVCPFVADTLPHPARISSRWICVRHISWWGGRRAERTIEKTTKLPPRF